MDIKIIAFLDLVEERIEEIEKDDNFKKLYKRKNDLEYELKCLYSECKQDELLCNDSEVKRLTEFIEDDEEELEEIECNSILIEYYLLYDVLEFYCL